MNQPDVSGDILRAIAGSYQEELGPARVEQLVNRAMARAGVRSVRSPARRLLAPVLALGVALLAVGIVGLNGDDPPVPDPDPPAPVAAAPPEQDPISEVVTSPVVSIPTEELEEALDLIDQQKELEAAEVVVRVLSSLVTPVGAQSDSQEDPPSAAVEVESEETQTRSSSATGGVPPEQSTYLGGGEVSETQAPESAEAETPEAEGSSEVPDSQPVTTQSQPTIEELGQVLKVEVEELLSAEPADLAQAAEKARDAATPILEYGQEPSILLPPDG